MPLNMDFTKIKNFEELHSDKWELILSESIGFLTTVVGIGNITVGNAEEVAARITVHENSSAPMLGESYHISYDDVVKRVGLSTNATPKTEAKFKKDVIESLMANAKMDVRRAKRRMENSNA